MKSAQVLFESWRSHPALDSALQPALASMQNNAASIEDAFGCTLAFGTGGLRGVLGAGTNRMNLYNVRRATKGFADYINSQNPEYRQRGVVIA